ncbi:MAG: hypothetical protein C0467_13065 [Planctomycetaceae bacterium]|nr:hypothetical protein [Planctomycetaceae bacterium]
MTARLMLHRGAHHVSREELARTPTPARVVPSADPVLRESVARVTARKPQTWGFVLARLRVALGQTFAEQANAIGCSESALTYLSICRMPRAGRHRDLDLMATADFIAVSVVVLLDLLTANTATGQMGSVPTGECRRNSMPDPRITSPGQPTPRQPRAGAAPSVAAFGASRKPLDPLVAGIADMMTAGLAQASADGGAASEAVRKADNKHIPCLYPAVKPPELNDDGSLVDPDAGPPALPKKKKKTPKKK